MFLRTLPLISTLLSPTLATSLYVSSYNGNITTLSLTPNIGSYANSSSSQTPIPLSQPQEWTYDLTAISTFNTSTQSPSWLTLNPYSNILYLMDEATTSGNGTVVSYRVDQATGELTELKRRKALAGGVYGTFFANGDALVVPHYTGSALQTYHLNAKGGLRPLQTFVFTQDGPGPVPNRQDSPHPHETILDPTQQYILVPDLGADLVRIFAITTPGDTPTLTAVTSLSAAPGSGPRHGAFSLNPISGEYVFYLGAEISATVTAYRVEYLPNQGGLQFTEISGGVYPSLGAGHPVPPTTTGESTGITAEVAFSPDGNFLIASNRRDLSFNSTTQPISYPIPSDSLATWRFNPGSSDGSLEFVGLSPAGGSYPRMFSLNRAGNLAAVGLQESGSVVVWERDVETGAFLRQVGAVDGLGMVTCVVWDE